MPYHVLVVDDEPQVQRFLRPSLIAEGYDVVSATSGRTALEQFQARQPDVVVLDLGLPDMDGKEVITRIRASSNVPIIILSAREQEAEKIEALDLGANDYVNKPAAIGELMARIRSALRQSARTEGLKTAYHSGALAIDTLTHSATLNGEPLKLTPKEFELLNFLVRYAGRVITHRQILTKVWGPAHAEDAQYLRVLIRRLREKIEDDPGDPKVILTEAGIGYRLAEPGDGS
jgi:two-component system, OmpR family, KDP operon response regulator KdpE